MQIVVALLLAGMVIFAVWSSVREIKAYRHYLKGSREYLISRQRRNRRLFIAFLLILEAAMLFLGIYVLNFTDPVQALVYWLPPLIIIFWMMYLGIRDFRQTSKDLDVIVREAAEDFYKR